jgi:hypothetical protein
MASSLVVRPVVRWEGFALRFDLDMVELVANRQLARLETAVRRIALTGSGDELEIHVDAAWKGLPAHLSARVRELRLHRRFFGCRIQELRGPFGVPLPVSLASVAVRRLGEPMLRFDPDDHILLVDLRRFLPEGLEVRVRDVRCEDRWLCLELDAGSATAQLAGLAGGPDRAADVMPPTS